MSRRQYAPRGAVGQEPSEAAAIQGSRAGGRRPVQDSVTHAHPHAVVCAGLPTQRTCWMRNHQ
eukprot:4766296-Alexandrium_andersonii.AAC.1